MMKHTAAAAISTTVAVVLLLASSVRGIGLERERKVSMVSWDTHWRDVSSLLHCWC